MSTYKPFRLLGDFGRNPSESSHHQAASLSEILEHGRKVILGDDLDCHPTGTTLSGVEEPENKLHVGGFLCENVTMTTALGTSRRNPPTITPGTNQDATVDSIVVVIPKPTVRVGIVDLVQEILVNDRLNSLPFF